MAGLPWSALPLALAAAIYPPAILVLLVLLAREPVRPRALAYLAGAALMTVGVGILGVTVLHGTKLAGAENHGQLSGAADVAIGAVLLAFAAVVQRRPPRAARTSEASGWQRRLLGRPATAFVLGAAMYAPSPLYIAALKTVADAGLSGAGDAVWVLLLSACVLLFVEIPVAAALVWPQQTREHLAGLDRLLKRHARLVVVAACAAAGAYMLVRGFARLL